MSFRIEEKISISKKNIILFKNYLIKNKAEKLFEPRIINSIYFDNDNFQMFDDSEEGIVPRKKIRIRYYDNDDYSLLEKKISSAEGRFKISNRISNKDYFLKYGLLDDTYGLCKPKVKVYYLRSYYKLNKFRVTIDVNISYQKFSHINDKFKKNTSEEVVVEIKSNNLSNYNDFEKEFPFTKLRFSKYSKAISSIYNY
jgi:SPX domain protein involved in polyphosphate accumulation|tara:strand:+ start:320 stop:913 length:594 start_codon:yes stop_codon:yes gene_type:complete